LRLFIAEKPSLGMSIAEALHGATQRGDGFVRAGNDVVTWCIGHLLEQIKPEEYDPKMESWAMETLPFFPDKWRSRPRSVKDKYGRDIKDQNGKVKLDAGVLKQIKTIKGLIDEADEIIHAGDPDREGQLIVDELLMYLGNKKPAKRIWLRELNVQGIKKALGSLKPNGDYQSTCHAASARSRSDWLIGMNMTRGYTIAWQAAGNSKTIHIGRVQTPTLGLIVERDRDIEYFKPHDYFVLHARIRHQNGDFVATWKPGQAVPVDSEGRVACRVEADRIADTITSRSGHVASLKIEDKSAPPPLPFCLAELQKAANKFGLSPQRTLDAAQSLYEKRKLTSYPRSDCPYLPESEHANALVIIETVRKNFGATYGEIFKGSPDPRIKSGAWNDKKLGAHSGIIPTDQKSAVATLTSDERIVYELIARNYLVQFYAPYRYQSTVVETACEGELFVATGQVLTAMGWRELFGGAAKDEDAQHLPPMNENDSIHVKNAEVIVKKTTPPPRFNGASLIDAMSNIHRFVTDLGVKKTLKETQGIGTEATRAGIIENLIHRGYVDEVKKGKRTEYFSSARGRATIAMVTQELAKPDLTAWFEGKLTDIVDKKLSLDAFMAYQEKFLLKLFEGLSDAHMRVTTLPDQGSHVSGAGKVFWAPCPKCGGEISEVGKRVACSCGFGIWRVVAGKKLPVVAIESLLKSGISGSIKGFKSKSGKAFDASLKLLEDGKVEFVFC
jgi:DNA topoisomerase-3